MRKSPLPIKRLIQGEKILMLFSMHGYYQFEQEEDSSSSASELPITADEREMIQSTHVI